MNERKSWTLDDDCQASNPGRVSISGLRWIRHYPKWPIFWAMSLAASLPLALEVDWFLWVVSGLLFLANVWYWVRVREHFERGCVNPAVVVSLRPTLIAVLTDLSTRGEPRYVIKIVRKRPPKVGGRPLELGMRLPTVSLYHSYSEKDLPFWDDFDPRPVACATNDEAQVYKTMATLKEDGWAQLEAGLAELPQPFVPGLYPIRSQPRRWY